MTEPFVHLHVHSHYSLLDGAAKVPELVAKAKELKMPALAITDHGNLFGALEFYGACQKAGIKPIIGYEAYLAPNHLKHEDNVEEMAMDEQMTETISHTVNPGDTANDMPLGAVQEDDSSSSKKKKKKKTSGKETAGAAPKKRSSSRDYSHVTLLAKNYQGYCNLMRLASIAYIEGFYYKPRIDKELLFQYREGLIVLSGCLRSPVCQALLSQNLTQAEAFAKAEAVVAEFRDAFPGDYYIELQYNRLETQNQVNEQLIKLADRFQLPLVFTNDIHYLRAEDAKPHDILLCIQTGRKAKDEKRFRFASQEFYMKSSEQMYEESKYFPNAAANTALIAEKVNIEMPKGKNHLPKFECPDNKSNEVYLRELCEQGLVERYGTVTPALRERFEEEFRVISKMGFVPYFLIVWDFINYAREHGIGVGPGRGSAAGSIVSYVLHITNLDPLPYNLLFERFLNEGRNDMPDIDIDFETKRRGEVIEYVTKKYGKEKVCQIITFGTMAARNAIRDVGRVLDYPISEVDKIAKKVPEELKITLEKALAENVEFKQEYETNPIAKEIIDIARRLEGLARQPGTHAAGVIIADQNIMEYCPLYLTPDQTISTQYTMEYVVNLGLLKMDFLGLSTLTLIEEALKMIQESRGETVDLATIPLNDMRTYDMLCHGNTNGVFQLESKGMQELVKKLRPDCFADMVALVALYRPGPLESGMVDDYCDCKHGNKRPEYKHPIMQEILKETHGVILYQEQVMRISCDLAGFSLTESDKLRKAMGKKRVDIMDAFRQKFIDGAMKKHQLDPAIGKDIFDLMAFFSGYGFNKSHSAAYALISYQTAYLKAHYFKEFMSALMTIESDDADKIAKYIHECSEQGVKVLPPDVNTSRASFWPMLEGIRFGLGAIKGCGEKALTPFLEARPKVGKFVSLFDLCEKMQDTEALDKRVLEALTKSGGFDCFGVPRDRIMATIPSALEMMSAIKKRKNKNQDMLDFAALGAEDNSKETAAPQWEYAQEPYTKWTEEERLRYERETLGMALAHPAKHQIHYAHQLTSHKICDLVSAEHDAEVLVAGIVSSLREITVKKEGRNQGRRMAQVQLDDFSGGNGAAICFPDAYEKYGKLLKADNFVFVRGKVDRQKGDPQIKIDEIVPWEEGIQRFPQKITLHFTDPSEELLQNVRKACGFHIGRCDMYIRIRNEGRNTTIRPRQLQLNPCLKLIEDIETLLGPDGLHWTSNFSRGK